MDKLNFDNSAVHGVTDTSGVKDAISVPPEEQGMGVSEVAARSKKTVEFSEIPVTGEIENDADVDEVDEKASLEAEFDALISGRFKEIYKRRTEGIIRRRLKGRKAHFVPSESGESSVEKESSEVSESGLEKETNAPITPETVVAEGKDTTAVVKETTAQRSEPSNDDSEKEKEGLYEKALIQNKNRPLESGLRASAGIVTRVNVSSLDGSGVLDIVKRVRAGEKISFN